ncbi:hypothetical protein U1Q18_030019 [Sarracenia purpurea var. burkii]
MASPEPEKTAPPPPPPESKVSAPPSDKFVVVDAVLRLLLFASALTAVLVIVTSKQTKVVGRLPFPPFSPVSRSAEFGDSPAFVYFVVALSVAGAYGLITTLVSFLALLKPGSSTKILAHFVILDALLLGIVSSAVGAAGGVGYIGLKGLSHVGWNKVCNIYGRFCAHVVASAIVALGSSIVLVLLVILSAYSLSKKIPK